MIFEAWVPTSLGRKRKFERLTLSHYEKRPSLATWPTRVFFLVLRVTDLVFKELATMKTEILLWCISNFRFLKKQLPDQKKRHRAAISDG